MEIKTDFLTRIKSAKVGEVIWDKGSTASVKGLQFKLNAGGKGSFLIYYRTKGGVQRRPKIGDFPEISIGEARSRAKEILKLVANGEDPKGNWDTSKSELTVDQLFQKVWADYWDTERFHQSEWAYLVKCYYNTRIKPTFGTTPISKIDTVDVRRWHQKMSKYPTTANRSLEVLSKMMSYAEEFGFKSLGTNPCKLTKFKARKRNRYATVDEIRGIAAILEREVNVNPAAVAFIYLLMFTGSRPRAIERATWEQLKVTTIDGQKYGMLTFQGKSSEETGEVETVVLPPQAMMIINKLPKVRGGTLTGINMPRRLWKKIQDEVGCHDLWIRDLRRTFATIGMSDGMGASTIGEILNHKSTQTTKIYAKLMQTSRIEGTSQIANQMAKLMLPEETLQ